MNDDTMLAIGLVAIGLALVAVAWGLFALLERLVG